MARIALIGLGTMGRTHRQTVLDGKIAGLEVRALSGSAESLASLPERAGESRFQDAGDMIRSGEIDAVLCCTPHPQHAPIGIAALHAGLHVLMEKPLGVHRSAAARAAPSRRR